MVLGPSPPLIGTTSWLTHGIHPRGVVHTVDDEAHVWITRGRDCHLHRASRHELTSTVGGDTRVPAGMHRLCRRDPPRAVRSSRHDRHRLWRSTVSGSGVHVRLHVDQSGAWVCGASQTAVEFHWAPFQYFPSARSNAHTHTGDARSSVGGATGHDNVTCDREALHGVANEICGAVVSRTIESLLVM